LPEREKYYRAILDAANDAVFVHDEAGRVIDVNARMCTMFRCEPGDALSISANSLSFGESPYSELEAQQKIALALEQGSTTFEWRSRRLDGTLFWSEVTLHRASGPGQCLIIASVRDTSAQKEAEEALRLSEERYRALSSLAREGIMLHADGKVLDVNQAFLDIIGFSDPSEIVGRDGMATTPFTPESRQRVLDNQRFPSPRPCDIELVRRDGTRIHAETVGRAATFLGRPARLVLMRDITDRKHAEQALSESEERFRHLFDAGADAIFVYDEQGKLLDVNRAAAESVGYSRAELLRLNMRDIATRVSPARLEELLDGVRKRGRVTLEGYHQRQDGTNFPVDVRITLFRTEDGPRYFAAARDITEKKALEDARQQRERRLAMAISATADAIWEWNVKTGQTYYSPRWYEMLGYDDQAFPMTFDTWRQLCHPDEISATIERIRASLFNPISSGYAIEFRMHARDGSWRWIFWRGNVVERDDKGAPLLVSGTNTDVTERKRNEAERLKLEESLRHAQKLESIGRLAGGVAHDFNNFLTAIQGNVSLALSTVDRHDAIHELLSDVDRAAESAAKLTHQLLAFSRKQVIIPKVISLNDLIVQLHNMLQRLLGENFVLETTLAPGIASVRIDPGQMEQILVNLVVNARDAMPDGGTLRIETRSAHLDPWFSREHAGVESGSYVELAVSDHGVGMTEEVRAHVFEPFYTTKETGKGTGLGLAMVYGAVHQNRGCVDVVSEPSRGTTFTIYLPAAEDAGPRISAADHERIPRGTETIVLVEDDSNVRQVAVRMLQRQGYTVCPCADGKEALAALGGASASTAPAHVKLLVTDVVMPGMNGRSLADKARGMLPDLKILFTSGYPEDTVAHHGVVEEGIEFLAKPYTLTGLATRVREVLDGPAAIRETR